MHSVIGKRTFLSIFIPPCYMNIMKEQTFAFIARIQYLKFESLIKCFYLRAV